jgi:micrococcal nuclease
VSAARPNRRARRVRGAHRPRPAGAPPTVLTAALVASVAISLAACAAHPVGAPDPSSVAGPNALVVRVVDGDTVVVAVGGTEESARLIGIDTPETKRPDTPVECFGPEASDRLTALLPPGTPVRLELDEEPRDRYGRLLVYLHRSSDGAFINQVMAAEGFADALSIAPNTAYDRSFADAVDAARSTGTGLWATCPDAHSPAG